VGLLKKSGFGKNEIKKYSFKNIILKGLQSIAQGKGSKAEGRQPATLGGDRKKEKYPERVKQKKLKPEV
jgi:hypothetical protein